MNIFLRFALPAIFWAAAPVVGARAQAPAPPPVPDLVSDTPSPDVALTITVTGCLRPVDAPAAAGTSGTVGTTSATPVSKYTLVNARAADSTQAATPGERALTSTASNYRLFGNESALMPEIGHQVEVAGMVDRRESRSTAENNTATSDAPKMRVISIRTVAGSCQH